MIKSLAWIGGVFLLMFATWYFWPPPDEIFQKKLPPTAKEVQVWLQEDGLLPDYTYLLRARITKEEFEQYVAELSLTPHSAERKYDDSVAWLSWSAQPLRGSAPEWWIPTRAQETTFVRQERQNWTYAKHENGYVYLKSLNH